MDWVKPRDRIKLEQANIHANTKGKYMIVCEESILDGLSKSQSASELGPDPGSIIFAE